MNILVFQVWREKVLQSSVFHLHLCTIMTQLQQLASVNMKFAVKTLYKNVSIPFRLSVCRKGVFEKKSLVTIRVGHLSFTKTASVQKQLLRNKL